MALPKQLRPHKDKIIMLGMAAGGLYAAAVKFEFMSLTQLKGWPTWVVIAVAGLGLYTFFDGYVNAKKRKLAQMQGQPQMQAPPGPPSMDALYAQPQQPYPAPPQQYASAPIGGTYVQGNQAPAPKDIFEGFN